MMTNDQMTLEDEIENDENYQKMKMTLKDENQ